MSISLEERKKNLIEQLKEEYADKPRRWWQSKEFEYWSTWERGNVTWLNAPQKDEIVIKNNQKHSIASIVLISFGNLIAFIPGLSGNFLTFFYLVWNILLIYTIKNALDRKPKIIINDEGLWLNNVNITFSWQHIVATYIKQEFSGDSSCFYLVVHYYDEFNDGFIKKQLSLGDFDISNDAIAFYIEYWRNKTGYPSAESQNS